MRHDVFNASGYELTQDAVGKHIHAIVKLTTPPGYSGKLEALRFLRASYMLRLLTNAQVRKDIAYTYKQWRLIANPHKETLEFIKILTHLVERRLLLRGYTLECEECGITTWHPLEDLREEVACHGCFSHHFLPLEFTFTYRLNPLIIEAIKNGALTVILAALHLQEENEGIGRDFQWQAGLQFERGSFSADVDLVAKLDYVVHLVEAKDAIHSAETVITQLKKLQKIGEDLKRKLPSVICFATLAETIPPEILAFCEQNNVRVLTRAELVRE